jgi:DNA primase
MANTQTAEGRARAAEIAIGVLSEHPSDLVRDQYLTQVADRLRLDLQTLRPRLAAAMKNPGVKPVVEEPRAVVSRVSFDISTTPRPGLEAIRLCLHFDGEVRDRFISQYFTHDAQRSVFEAIREGGPVSDAIDLLRRHGEEMAAQMLSQLSVDELDRIYTMDDVTSVVSQLLRNAVAQELRNVERELREGALAPDLAMATMRDVKERVALLEGPHNAIAENDLRLWLEERTSNS